MIQYAIPPMTPKEALECIVSGEYHRNGCVDYQDGCGCVLSLARIVLGRPGPHQPGHALGPLDAARLRGIKAPPHNVFMGADLAAPIGIAVSERLDESLKTWGVIRGRYPIRSEGGVSP